MLVYSNFAFLGSLPCEIFFHFRSSSFETFWEILASSYKPKFKVWPISARWLLRYSNFVMLDSLRVKVIEGSLPFEKFGTIGNFDLVI